MRFVIYFLCFFSIANVHAATGDFLYVKGNVVNLRTEATTNSSVVLKLNKGHKLIEIQKKVNWIEVSVDGTGGTTGWIYAPLVSRSVESLVKKESKYHPFNKFLKNYFNRINNDLYTNAEHLGDGIINIHVNYNWLSITVENKTRNMNILLEAWSKCEAGIVSINMVHPSGRFIMSKTKQ